MKQFDIKRFGRLTKWSLVCGWKSWLKVYVIWSLAWFFVFAIMTWTQHGVDFNGQAEHMTTQMGGFYLIGLFIAWFSIAPSQVGVFLKTKQERIGFLSLPATNLEKFVANFAMIYIGYFIVTILGGWTADILRFIFKALIGDYSSNMVMLGVARSFLDFPQDAVNIQGGISLSTVHMIEFTVAMGCVYVYSLYLLGGVVFRKSQWLMSSIVIMILLMMSVAFVNKCFVVNGEAEAIAFFKGLCAVFAALSIFNVWASYKVFTRMQVINNKWTNL